MNIQVPNFGDVELLNFSELSKTDVNYVLKMRNHPEIKKWMYNQQDITEAQHFSFIEKLKTDISKEYFLVKQADKIIGSINFVQINQSEKMADFGLYANPFDDLKGAGRILEEVAACYAKDKLNLSVLNLEVFEHNERAINFYNKIGFKKTGSHKVNNHIVLCMQKTI